MDRIPVTPQGLEKIRKELEQLKSVERPQNIRDIEEAMAHGDLSENAEYHAAKERKSHLDGRVQLLESLVSQAEVIDPKKMKGQTKAMFGAHVTLLDVDSDKKVTYQIVGEMESDIQSGKISVNAPLSRAVIGKSKGDEVQVKTPKGPKDYEVVAVEIK